MNIADIMSLTTWDDRLTELKVDTIQDRKPAENRDYYNGKHPILTDPDRQDFSVPTYEIDPETNKPAINEQTGRPIEKGQKVVKRTRMVLNYARQLVETAKTMVLGEPVDLILNNADKTPAMEESFSIFKQQWDNAHLDSFNLAMLESLLIETKVAEIYYIEDADVNKDLKVLLLSKENGDDFWVHFDDNKRADALTREFTKRALVAGKADNVRVTQVWTADKLYEKIGAEEWTEKPNIYKKNVWVYYTQNESEFETAKPIITRLEYSLSQLADVNKRIGNPGVVVKGKVGQLPQYDDDVKMFEVQSEETSDGKPFFGGVELLETSSAPESIKLEIDFDQDHLYKTTWGDLYQLYKGGDGGAISGTAIKLRFTAFKSKMVSKHAILENFNRRISVMKTILQTAKGGNFEELEISVKFNSILPENLVEITDMMSTAVNSGLTSKENAVGQLSYNENPADVLAQMESERGKIDSNSQTI